MFPQELCSSLRIPAILCNEMAHRLPGLFSSRLSGVCWDQPNLAHFRSPLSIVIPFSRRLSKVMLPQMGHFMGEGCKNLLRLSGCKVQRVESNLVGYILRVGRIHKPLTAEKAIRPFMPLHGYKAGRQTPGKEFLIEEIVSAPQTVIPDLDTAFY